MPLPRWPQRLKRRSTGWLRCRIISSTTRSCWKALRWRRLSRLRPPTCPPCFPRQPTDSGPNFWRQASTPAWLLMPLRGRKRYKRCTRAFKVRITPHMAEEVESFEGVPLSDYLQDQLGLPEGAEVEAEVHLYEALPGTTVADIARSESETPGLGRLGRSDRIAIASAHTGSRVGPARQARSWP